MTNIMSRDIQPVRIRELRGIPVGRAQHSGNKLALADLLSFEFCVLGGHAPLTMNRPVIPQELLDGCRKDRGIGL